MSKKITFPSFSSQIDPAKTEMRKFMMVSMKYPAKARLGNNPFSFSEKGVC
jgi:hypothetical protein